MGSETWSEWKKTIMAKKRMDDVKVEKCQRRFRFGDDKVLVATMKVALTVRVFGVDFPLEGADASA